MTPVQAAYLAGLLDGEGCIQARANGEGQWVRPAIEVCMTNPTPLEWAAETTGVGSIYACRPDARGRRRRAWKWVISNPLAGADMLRQTIPFMHVKKGEAMAFVTLSSMRRCTPPGRRRAHPVGERIATALIATLKANGGEPRPEAYQEALDLCVYLRQAIEEQRRGR